MPTLSQPIEFIEKEQVCHALALATKTCKTKAQYGKGAHSFKLLALVDPDTVAQASP